MKRIVGLCLAGCGLMALMGAPQQVQARPQYSTAFIAKYETVKKEANEKKCGICHGDEGKNKKQKSDYAKALEKALGEKNVKDKQAITEAFAKVEKEKIKEGSEMTYGELIKSGKLPEPFKE